MNQHPFIKAAQDIHLDIYTKIEAVCGNLKNKSKEELVDVGWAAKKASECFDDLRKELNKLESLAARLTCLKATEEEVVKVKGTYATASTELKMSANLPSRSKNPEEYVALCEFLGIPSDLNELDLIRVHWPGFTELYTRLSKEGKPTPPGIDIAKTHAIYSLRYRERK